MNRRTLKDVAKVVVSNFISLGTGIFVAFFLPKTTSVTDFGYYKTFTLYTTYVGLLHLGFCDGIYLKYGGMDLSDLDPKDFRLYFKVLSAMEFFFSLIIISFTAYFIPSDLKFIFYSVALYSFFHIYGSYFQLISQATRRFHEFSLRTIIYSAIRFVVVFSLWLYSKHISSPISYKVYVLFLIVLEFLMAIWYVHTYRIISIGNCTSLHSRKYDIIALFKSGFPLLITNLTSTLLLNLDRQFVNILFSKDIYAIYAFAYSLLSLITIMTSAVATVLFPELKRISKEKLQETYSSLISGILIAVYFALAAYFPLTWFISWFLPKYVDSLIIFRVIFPGLAISSSITICMYNYYKVLGKTSAFLRICLLILLISGVANYLAFFFFGTPVSISIASIICMILWYIISERYFIKLYHIRYLHNILYIIVMTGTFYFITSINNNIVGLLCYLVFVLLFTLLFHGSLLKKYLKR